MSWLPVLDEAVPAWGVARSGAGNLVDQGGGGDDRDAEGWIGSAGNGSAPRSSSKFSTFVLINECSFS